MATSEEFRSRFKAVLDDEKKFDELTEQLGSSDLIPLLVKFKGLEKIEGDELKGKLRGKLGRERNRVVIGRIVAKDTYDSYKALSQVLEYKNSYIWKKLFPFAQGAHSQLVVQPYGSQAKLIQPAANQPSIIWLCANQRVFDAAADKYCKRSTPTDSIMSGSIKYLELPLTNDCNVNVWLCLPDVRGSNSIKKIDMYKLYQTYCRTKYCIYTGECVTAWNNNECLLGDICVTKKKGTVMSAFTATLEHRTHELMQSNTKGIWCCEFRENAEVVFGEIGGSVLDNWVDFASEDGLYFCEKSEDAYKKGAKMKYAGILMVTKDERGEALDEWCQCKSRNIEHAVDYTHSIINELIDKETLSIARSGRNPSV